MTMSRTPVRLASVLALALLGLGSAGFAYASVAAIDRIESATLSASAPPALLGPVNELGRAGWQCTPEQAALAKKARDAQLPAPDTR